MEFHGKTVFVHSIKLLDKYGSVSIWFNNPEHTVVWKISVGFYTRLSLNSIFLILGSFSSSTYSIAILKFPRDNTGYISYFDQSIIIYFVR